jgi:hypothetical protein
MFKEKLSKGVFNQLAGKLHSAYNVYNLDSKKLETDASRLERSSL